MMSLIVSIFVFPGMLSFAESEDLKSNDSEVVRAILVEDGVEKEINPKEYDRILEGNEEKLQQIEGFKEKEIANNNGLISAPENNSVTPFAIINQSRYVQAGLISSVYRTDLKKRVSVPVYNGTTQKITRTISYSASRGYTSNVSLSSSYAKSAVQATVGASWNKSSSSSDSISQPIPLKIYSWVEYTPNMKSSYGTTYEEVWNYYAGSNVKIIDKKYFLDLYIAKKGNAGLPDGIYAVKEASKAPK